MPHLAVSQPASSIERAQALKVWDGYAEHDYESFAQYAPANQPIDLDNPDYALLNAAIFYATNRQRAQAGLPIFKHSPAMERAAWMHAIDMAEQGFFDHSNTRDRRKRNPGNRADLFDGHASAENIAQSFGIQYKAGTRVSSTANIPPHTYNSFAQAMLIQWMNSPGHRANIMRRGRYEYLGCGAYPRPRDTTWRRFNGVQNFGAADDPTG